MKNQEIIEIIEAKVEELRERYQNETNLKSRVENSWIDFAIFHVKDLLRIYEKRNPA